jgi:hypothetical protein
MTHHHLPPTPIITLTNQAKIDPAKATTTTTTTLSPTMPSLKSVSDSDEQSVSSTSGRGDQSTSNATSSSGQEMLEDKERMFQNESKQVRRLKGIVLLIMILAGIAVSAVVYVITKNSEISQFEAMYEGAAEKLLGKSHTSKQTFLSTTEL